MNELGRLDDLPLDYREALARQNLVPLWPSLRAVLPPDKPQPRTRATHWSYEALRPLLLTAGELTPIEKAERRVLVLANPGHGLERMQASAAMYLGMQLLLPGEWAPAHRHTPNAVRMIVEGEGAYTTVDGERQKVKPGRGDRAYARAGMVPTPVFQRAASAYPMLRYPWANTRAALEGLAAESSAENAIQVTYVNPETGADVQNILAYRALMLRPGETLRLPARSPAAVFHLIQGAAEVRIGEQSFGLDESDTCCAPGYAAVTLSNRSSASPAFFFVADETPLHQKLGVYEQ